MDEHNVYNCFLYVLFSHSNIKKEIQKHTFDIGEIYDLGTAIKNAEIKGGYHMKSMKKLITVGICAIALSAMAVTTLAAQYKTPAEAVAGLTNRDVQSVIDERTTEGKTYGTIASEAGVLEAFKAEMLALKKDALAERVAAGTMTQERADAILAAIEANQAICDGTGTGAGGCGLGNGAGCGFGGGFGGRYAQGR